MKQFLLLFLSALLFMSLTGCIESEEFINEAKQKYPGRPIITLSSHADRMVIAIELDNEWVIWRTCYSCTNSGEEFEPTVEWRLPKSNSIQSSKDCPKQKSTSITNDRTWLLECTKSNKTMDECLTGLRELKDI